MKTNFVYILKCCDGLTYTGFTNNISRRLEEHQKGLNKIYFAYKIFGYYYNLQSNVLSLPDYLRILYIHVEFTGNLHLDGTTFAC